MSPANLRRSTSLWKMVDAGYCAIDWQLDFKSGWRWSERTWHGDVTFGVMPGADIKVPWELGRMQHLPRLALAAALARSSHTGFLPPDDYEREFRNEILDFMAANPPRFGVGWTVSMDVAIRLVNWLVAYDLFCDGGSDFDLEFVQAFEQSVVEHGAHLATHLEWVESQRSNHYIADLVGLLFAAAYLPRTDDHDVWLALAVQELVAEAATQFTSEGTGVEASTSYHRLSAEVMIHAVAMIAGFGADDLAALATYDSARYPRPSAGGPALRPGPVRLYQGVIGLESPLPPWLPHRLGQMAEFAIDITKPNGQVVQIGDNDSGRLLSLVPLVRGDGTSEPPWRDDHLDHVGLVAAANGLLRRDDLAEFASRQLAVTEFVATLCRGSLSCDPALASAAAERRIGDDTTFADLADVLTSADAASVRRVMIDLPGASVMGAPDLGAYPEFGLFVLRWPRVFLSIRCGPAGQTRVAGHAHNDQLAIELNVDGDDWIRDPGSYLYTASVGRRNEYRSARAHFVPQLDGPEPRRLDLDPFALGDETEGSCLYWGPLGFAGRVTMAGGRSVVGLVRPLPGGIELAYHARGCSFVGAWASPQHWRDLVPTIAFSPGYGVIEALD